MRQSDNENEYGGIIPTDENDISIEELIAQRNKRKRKEKKSFINVSRIKNYIKQKNCEVSHETMDIINEKVQKLVDDAIYRTRSNKRITIRPYDL